MEKEFKVKSAEEIDKMTVAETAEYFTQKAAHETKLAIEAQDKKIEEATKNNASKEEIEALKSQNVQIQKALDEVTLRFKAMSEAGNKKEEVKKTDLVKWFTGEDRKKFAENKSGMHQIVLKVDDAITYKAAEAMSISAIGAGSAHITTASGYSINVGNFIDPKIYSTPKNQNAIINRVNIISAPGTDVAWWSERGSEEGDAQFLAEGGTKPLVDANWSTFSSTLREVAERWKYSHRLMFHAPSVVRDFDAHARQLIEVQIDDDVLNGDGIAPNIEGITTAASAFVVPTGLANFYDFVNIWDDIMAVKTQIEVANFMPNTVMLNTVWMAKMFGIKSETEAMYIHHPLLTPDGRSMAGMEIVFTNKIPATHILVGDLSKFNVVFGENIKYYEGWENDDFTKNLVSRKLEAFLTTYIPSTDAPAIVYDEIATIEAAIGNPAS